MKRSSMGLDLLDATVKAGATQILNYLPLAAATIEVKPYGHQVHGYFRSTDF